MRLGKRAAGGVDQRLAGDSPENRVKAHVVSSRDSDRLSTEKTFALIANFMRSPEYRKGAQEYYADILGRLDLTTEAGRRAIHDDVQAILLG